MAHYLVTGCAGFIASKVTEFLLADGHTVCGVDVLNDAYDVRLKDWRLEQLLPRTGFEFVRLDIADREAVAALFSDQNGQRAPFDAIINLAARAGVRQSVEDPWIYYDANTTGTLNLLEMCRAHDVGKFVLASTSSLYGENSPMPFREDADTSRPLSPYAASKKAAETLCYTYHHLYGLDVTVFRYFTVYGPAGRPDMSMFRFVKWIAQGTPVTIFGDGKQSRDFTYVEDIARGTILGLKPLGYEVINLGSDTPIALMDALHTVEQALDMEAQLQFQPAHAADVQATWADISKAERLLGWRPQVSFEQGIHNLVAWYRAQEAWAADVAT
ncbi:MAG: GDP-mannose 4,6-dehydratase [Litorilinea sp.]